MTCNPRVVHIDGRWQAWCKPCKWETGWTAQWSLAIHWKKQHEEGNA
jgi:hypothetical protein